MGNSGSPVRTAIIIIGVSAGIAVISTGSLGDVLQLQTGAATVALTVLVTTLSYGCYKLSQSVSVPTTTRTGDTERLDPEVVKQRTERWSDEATNALGFPPDQKPNRDSQPARPSEPTSSGIDLPEMEFAWQSETDVSFEDILGMETVKHDLRAEVIKPLDNPEKAEKLGVAAPNIVFHGPPGTGKTFTAKALATELGLPFASLSGADIQSKWINESASKVNDLFNEAREVAAREGGAVVFLDELDSVLKDRSGTESAHEEDNKVVNEFLNHLEDTKDHNVVFIGATNRLDALDQAGIRSGRIDLKIHVGKPDREARKAILRAKLAEREHTLSEDDIADLAAATDGAVAADLEQLVNRAAKNVLLRDGDTIHRSDID
jgi:SpoVK/Ycf46/Vps4 family AAA+-type ATPase